MFLPLSDCSSRLAKGLDLFGILKLSLSVEVGVLCASVKFGVLLAGVFVVGPVLCDLLVGPLSESAVATLAVLALFSAVAFPAGKYRLVCVYICYLCMYCIFS